MNNTIPEFLDELASGSATPGGGGAAALSGAMGAALLSMVCNLTIGRKKFADVSAEMEQHMSRTEQLRAELMRLIEVDATAFDKLMAAYRLPKGNEEEKEVRREAIQAGAKGATLVPMQVAQACAEVVKLAQSVAEKGNPNAISDVGAGVASAQAGLKTSVLNVLINLPTIKDEVFVAQQKNELERLLAETETLAETIYSQVKAKFAP